MRCHSMFQSLVAFIMIGIGAMLVVNRSERIVTIRSGSEDVAPRNVILLIGDGMGLSQLAAASLLEHGPAGGFAIESMHHIGLVRTSAADRLVSDSGASATAFATGHKTMYYGVSMEPGGIVLRTLFEAAEDKGMATGVMTTTALFDATPAAFIAHAERRSEFASIIRQMADSRTDVMLGGDGNLIAEAAAGRLDADAIVSDLRSGAREDFHFVTTSDAIEAAGPGRIMAMFPRRKPNVSDANDEDVYGPALDTLLRLALSRIGDHPQGFMLVVECEETDSAGHANDTDRLVRGVKELDRAVKLALAFAEERGDTLVIVTADHDTGDAKIIADRTDRMKPIVEWTTKDHSAEWVPIFAAGPGAARFTGVLDNTEVGRRIGELLNLPDFPKRTLPEATSPGQ